MLKHTRPAIAAITALATIATMTACSPVMITRAEEPALVGVYTNPAAKFDIPAPPISIDSPVLTRSYPCHLTGLGHIEAVSNCVIAPNVIRVIDIKSPAVVRIVADNPEATSVVSVNGNQIEINDNAVAIPASSALFSLDVSIVEPAPPEPEPEPVYETYSSPAPAYEEPVVEQPLEPAPEPAPAGPISTYVWYSTPLKNIEEANWDGTASWWNNWFSAHDFTVYGQAILGMHAGTYVTIDGVQYVTGEPFRYPKVNTIEPKRFQELGVTREELDYIITQPPVQQGYWWFTKQYDNGYYLATCDGDYWERLVPIYRV